ncbi:hypothetical protein BMW23_0451 [Bodo saltans virus]|uniref:Minor capsid protein P11 C-terminal conserved region domain-containing protein n=1 Tax=Bodo saltans virus TaxID=2024608 RepID=A0A2H4UU90_9VIRU|nr:hypothetical protein QJ851_gp0440 [Bodo saltans virus]ATZ80503.1 hypothetical protein BMW23_0451 [Bodo saltans virus]
MIGIIVFFFIQSNNSDTTSNQGSLTQNVNDNNDQIDIVLNDINSSEQESSDVGDDTQSYSDKYMAKFRTRDSSCGNVSNYADGKRGGNISDVDQFFTNGKDQGENYARYVPGKQRKETDADKFNSEALLPQENNKDWFDDPYEATSVKNTHLINIYRPIGVDTISTTLKNPSRDIRGAPMVPKYAVSPWGNSSWEPDTNIRNQSLCY